MVLMKRLLDLTAALIGTILLFPVWVIVAIVIKLTSPGPVFYCALRTGRSGVTFGLLKFRSMRLDADRSGPGITRAEDPRFTAIGHWLRHTKLDETPQLLNVLKGDMSLVGPRPEDPRYVAFYTPEQRRVLSVRPGITGAASVHYRHEEALLTGADWERTYLTVIMPDKLRLDLDYLDRCSLWSDVWLLGKTFWSLRR